VRKTFSGALSEDVSSWRIQKNGLLQGSVLAPIILNLYTNDLPVTGCQKFIYADDICLVKQAGTFSELECVFTADMARMEEYCHRWQLKASISKHVPLIQCQLRSLWPNGWWIKMPVFIVWQYSLHVLIRYNTISCSNFYVHQKPA